MSKIANYLMRREWVREGRERGRRGEGEKRRRGEGEK